eukprot:3865471-Ditylum_brightwellii.AAC.1
MNMTDWNCLGATLAKQHLFNKVCLVKFIHNWLHVGRRKNLMNHTDLGICLFCSKSHETWQHLFQCQHPDSLAIHSLALTSFHTAMINTKTSPALRILLKYKLSQWLKLDQGPPP